MSRSLFARLHRRYGTRLSGLDRRRELSQRLEIYRAASALDFTESIHKGGRRGPNVAVIGAGFAGLMAAWTLAGRATVTVFEARARVGGRVHSLVDDITKRITEAGGELIGYAHPTWLTLARRFELGLVVWTSDSDFDALKLESPTYIKGHRLSDAETEHVYDEMNAAFLAMAKDAEAIHDPERPWLADHADALDNRPLSDWIDKQPCSTFTKDALELQFANTNAAPSTRQSYLANLALVAGARRPGGAPDDFFTMSENARCARGNQALAEALGADIKRRGGALHLSNPIRKIEILPEKVHVTPAAGAAPIEYDFAILAIPPSLWPAANPDLHITPAIPAEYYMTMGTAVKYLSRAATRFWIAQSLAPSATSDRCGMLWEGTDNQMQAPHQDIELSLFAGGDAAGQALAAFTHGHADGVRKHYDERINEIYPSYAQHRRDATQFIAWPLDPWTRAGYSCPAPGDVRRAGPLLTAPYEKRLYFAGEHTCPPFFGYMEGALQSGARTAHAILSL